MKTREYTLQKQFPPDIATHFSESGDGFPLLAIVVHPDEVAQVEVHPVEVSVGVVQGDARGEHQLLGYDGLPLRPVEEGPFDERRAGAVPADEKVPGAGNYKNYY